VKSFQAFASTLSFDVQENRRQWQRAKPWDHRALEKWRQADPEIKDLDYIVKAQKSVDELRRQLSEAETELHDLIDRALLAMC
jgi:hypothetical protein